MRIILECVLVTGVHEFVLGGCAAVRLYGATAVWLWGPGVALRLCGTVWLCNWELETRPSFLK